MKEDERVRRKERRDPDERLTECSELATFLFRQTTTGYLSSLYFLLFSSSFSPSHSHSLLLPSQDVTSELAMWRPSTGQWLIVYGNDTESLSLVRKLPLLSSSFLLFFSPSLSRSLLFANFLFTSTFSSFSTFLRFSLLLSVFRLFLVFSFSLSLSYYLP